MTFTLDQIIMFIVGIGGIIIGFYKVVWPILLDKRSRSPRVWEGEERRSNVPPNTMIIDKDSIAKALELWERQIKAQEAQLAQMEKHHEIEVESNGILKSMNKKMDNMRLADA